ncbi:MAG: signal peptidase I [Clostridia bacterium]|nr:signal peptidase I [Clostridia bacterium]
MSFQTSRGQALPTLVQVAQERKKLQQRSRRRRSAASFIAGFLLIIISGVMILILFMPVLEVSGRSMEPTLRDGDVLILRHPDVIHPGAMCGMYAKGRLILKRIIALPGDVVDMDGEGNVYVNGEALQEPYVSQKCVGACDLSFPFQVPAGRLFVMGDHRETSIDSRSKLIGCVEVEQIVGQVVARIWPLDAIAWME